VLKTIILSCKNLLHEVLVILLYIRAKFFFFFSFRKLFFIYYKNIQHKQYMQQRNLSMERSTVSEGGTPLNCLPC